MPITVIAIGKKHESWVRTGIERYEARLKRPWNVKWVLLQHSGAVAVRAPQEESEGILARLHPDDYVVLLDEHGTLLDSTQLSATLYAPLERSQHIVVVIGGAYGVNDRLKTRANLIWSLSPLVFPHQLVRLLVSEQLYRAQEIATGRPYHHV